MLEIIIQRVSLDPHRRLRLRPTPSRPSGYDHIRDTSSVRWDSLCGEFYVHDVPEFSTLDEFREIIAAVACDYGDKLILSSATVYVDIPNALIAAMRESTA